MKRVLVVDDSLMVRRKLVTLLSAPELEIICAIDGAQGLLAAEAKRPQLMILDSKMPKIDGFSMLQLLKSRNLSIPTLVLTADANPVERKKFQAFPNVVEHLLKPFDEKNLRVLVHNILDLKSESMESSQNSGAGRMLIYSPDVGVLEALELKCQSRGECSMHMDLGEAVSELRRDACALIFLDMRQGPDKTEDALGLMQELVPQANFIAVVDSKMPSAKSRALELGFHHSLSYPFNSAVLEAFFEDLKIQPGKTPTPQQEEDKTSQQETIGESEEGEKLEESAEDEDAHSDVIKTGDSTFTDDGEGRRYQRRYRCDGAAVVWKRAGVLNFLTRKWNKSVFLDLADSGVGIEINEELAEGTQLLLEIYLLGEIPVVVEGLVCFGYRSEDKLWSVRYRIGIRFSDDPKNKRAVGLVRDYIAKHVGESVHPIATRKAP
jgi:DNA-binding NtrC family response regulator